MTQQEWNNNPSLAESLKAEMGKEIWQVAFSVWRELSYASLAANTPAPAITGNGDALAGKILGYEKAMQTLKSLATGKAPEPDRLIETYGVTTAEQATE